MIGGSWACRYARTSATLEPPFHDRRRVERLASCLLQPGLQRHPVNVLHHKVEAVGFDKGVRDVGQIRVVQFDKRWASRSHWARAAA